MIETIIIVVVLAALGGALYMRRTMPWPFAYEGRNYRRMPDGTFQDAEKQVVTDAALMPKLVKAYETAKYSVGDRDYNND